MNFLAFQYKYIHCQRQRQPGSDSHLKNHKNFIDLSNQCFNCFKCFSKWSLTKTHSSQSPDRPWPKLNGQVNYNHPLVSYEWLAASCLLISYWWARDIGNHLYQETPKNHIQVHKYSTVNYLLTSQTIDVRHMLLWRLK